MFPKGKMFYERDTTEEDKEKYILAEEIMQKRFNKEMNLREKNAPELLSYS